MPKKILIADDSKAFRQLEGEYLERKGYSLLYAENGAEAMRIAVEQIPDLILLDIQMPVMDGIQVLSFLKKGSKTSEIPVVIVTTLLSEETKKLVESGDAVELLLKPIRGIDLWAAIRPYLEPDEKK